MALPRVSVLVLNHNGRDHLEACLPTLVAQDYPSDRLRIEVIDNASTDDSIEFVTRTCPHASVRRFDRNLGFAEAYDRAVRADDSEFVALLNNDTRVEPTWLSELVQAAGRHDAACVGSRMLDWTGAHVDFAGGLLTFIGHSWQRDSGAPASREYAEDQLLFACAGSMLIRRSAYLEAGGFDRDYFAYFEDVDLGWRMSVLGFKTMFAPRAVTYHRLHGTAGRIAFAQRLRLYERNALATIFKNYETETLRRVLPAAIALSLARGLAHSGIDPRVFALGAAPPPDVGISTRTAVHLLALEDFCRQLPTLTVKREAIQSRRRVADRDLFPLFGEPFRLHEGGDYADLAHTLIRDLGIDDVFGAQVPGFRGSGVPGFRGSAGEPRNLGTSEPRNLETAEPRNPGTTPPFVSIVVLTALGPTHLRECLSSLRAQTYPADAREVIVVDNGSAEDPTAVAHECYPGARVIRNGSNLGFAAGNNIGARAATGTYVAFLNDDTRAHPDWLAALVGTARRRQAACVASRILTWDGQRIDFAGASVNLSGKGFQIDVDKPAAGRHVEERPLLFACGGAMLVQRDVFLTTDGWDEDTFAYYEDVELGWRFWMLGEEVWLSPDSTVFHKHHGTSGQWPAPPRARLYERNALRALYALLERPSLERVLPAALLLAADLALLATDLSRHERDADEIARDARLTPARRGRFWQDRRTLVKSTLRARGVTRAASWPVNLRRVGPRGLLAIVAHVVRGAPAAAVPLSRRRALQIERGAGGFALDGATETIPAGAAAALCGVHDFLRELPALSERRRRLQTARRRSDREILSRFGMHWTSPAPAIHQLAHDQIHRTLIETLDIADLARGETPEDP